ncbi:MAG: hypothetical protein RIC03_18580 [Cyclobacteriaceae bacterium]
MGVFVVGISEKIPDMVLLIFFMLDLIYVIYQPDKVCFKQLNLGTDGLYLEEGFIDRLAWFNRINLHKRNGDFELAYNERWKINNFCFLDLTDLQGFRNCVA